MRRETRAKAACLGSGVRRRMFRRQAIEMGGYDVGNVSTCWRQFIWLLPMAHGTFDVNQFKRNVDKNVKGLDSEMENTYKFIGRKIDP